jgi:hypothetical protein
MRCNSASAKGDVVPGVREGIQSPDGTGIDYQLENVLKVSLTIWQALGVMQARAASCPVAAPSSKLLTDKKKIKNPWWKLEHTGSSVAESELPKINHTTRIPCSQGSVKLTLQPHD